MVLESLAKSQYRKSNVLAADRSLCEYIILTLFHMEYLFSFVASSWSTLDFVITTCLSRVAQPAKFISETVREAIIDSIQLEGYVDLQKLSGSPVLVTLSFINNWQNLICRRLEKQTVNEKVITLSSTAKEISSLGLSFAEKLISQSDESTLCKHYVYASLYACLFCNLNEGSPKDYLDNDIYVHARCLFLLTKTLNLDSLKSILCSRVRLYYNIEIAYYFTDVLLKWFQPIIRYEFDNALLFYKASISLVSVLAPAAQKQFLSNYLNSIQGFSTETKEDLIFLVSSQIRQMPYQNATSLLSFWLSIVVGRAV